MIFLHDIRIFQVSPVPDCKLKDKH